ncbi:MAG: stage II sporulation protein M [Candidatus Bathyarchaeia archaeon]
MGLDRFEGRVSYVSSIKASLAFSSILFFGSALAAYYFSDRIPIDIIEVFRRAFGDLKEFDPIQLMLFIFFNNSLKSFMVILLGPALGIVPLFFTVMNGGILGLAMGRVIGSRGIAFALAAVLPHGILEIPAIIASSAIGFRLAWEVLRKIFSGGNVLRELKRGLRFFFLRIVPLLLVAAFIEAFITPAIALLISKP